MTSRTKAREVRSRGSAARYPIPIPHSQLTAHARGKAGELASEWAKIITDAALAAAQLALFTGFMLGVWFLFAVVLG